MLSSLCFIHTMLPSTPNLGNSRQALKFVTRPVTKIKFFF